MLQGRESFHSLPSCTGYNFIITEYSSLYFLVGRTVSRLVTRQGLTALGATFVTGPKQSSVAITKHFRERILFLKGFARHHKKHVTTRTHTKRRFSRAPQGSVTISNCPVPTIQGRPDNWSKNQVAENLCFAHKRSAVQYAHTNNIHLRNYLLRNLKVNHRQRSLQHDAEIPHMACEAPGSSWRQITMNLLAVKCSAEQTNVVGADKDLAKYLRKSVASLSVGSTFKDHVVSRSMQVETGSSIDKIQRACVWKPLKLPLVPIK